MRLVAIEEHILPAEVRDAWAAAPPPHDPVSAVADGGEVGARLADLGEDHLAPMDERGVDVQVLSLTTPGLHHLEPGPAVESARFVNDLTAQTCARRLDRFQGFAALPTSDPQATPRELERAVRDPGLKGALLCGRSRERHLDHADLRPMLAKAAELGVPLFSHPQTPAPAVREASYSGLGERADLALAAFDLGWHYEAGLQWIRLAAAGVIDELPELQVILGHWARWCCSTWSGRRRCSIARSNSNGPSPTMRDKTSTSSPAACGATPTFANAWRSSAPIVCCSQPIILISINPAAAAGAFSTPLR